MKPKGWPNVSSGVWAGDYNTFKFISFLWWLLLDAVYMRWANYLTCAVLTVKEVLTHHCQIALKVSKSAWWCHHALVLWWRLLDIPGCCLHEVGQLPDWCSTYHLLSRSCQIALRASKSAWWRHFYCGGRRINKNDIIMHSWSVIWLSSLF